MSNGTEELRIRHGASSEYGYYANYSCTKYKDTDINFEAPVLHGEFLELLQKSEELQLALVRGYKGIGFSSIKNPSEKVALEAVKNEPSLVFLVQDPTEEMKIIALKKYFNDQNLYAITKEGANSAVTVPFYDGLHISPLEWAALVKSVSYDYRVSLLKEYIVAYREFGSDINSATKFLQVEVADDLRIFAAQCGLLKWDYYKLEDKDLKEKIFQHYNNYKINKAELFLKNHKSKDKFKFDDVDELPVDMQKRFIDLAATCSNYVDIYFSHSEELLEYAIEKLPKDKLGIVRVGSVSNQKSLSTLLSKNGMFLKDVREECKSDELIRIAVAANSQAIQYVANPSVELQRFAVAQDYNNIKLIANPDTEAKKLAISLKRKDTIAKIKA
jgi:hypothetical protein